MFSFKTILEMYYFCWPMARQHEYKRNDFFYIWKVWKSTWFLKFHKKQKKLWPDIKRTIFADVTFLYSLFLLHNGQKPITFSTGFHEFFPLVTQQNAVIHKYVIYNIGGKAGRKFSYILQYLNLSCCQVFWQKRSNRICIFSFCTSINLFHKLINRRNKFMFVNVPKDLTTAVVGDTFWTSDPVWRRWGPQTQGLNVLGILLSFSKVYCETHSFTFQACKKSF